MVTAASHFCVLGCVPADSIKPSAAVLASLGARGRGTRHGAARPGSIMCGVSSGKTGTAGVAQMSGVGSPGGLLRHMSLHQLRDNLKAGLSWDCCLEHSVWCPQCLGSYGDTREGCPESRRARRTRGRHVAFFEITLEVTTHLVFYWLKQIQAHPDSRRRNTGPIS